MDGPLQQTDEIAAIPGTEGPVLRFRSLDLQTGTGTGISRLDLQLSPGQTLAIVTDSERAARQITRVAMGLEPIQGGSVELLGEELGSLREQRRLDLRRQVGMTFHNSGLLYNLTVWYNVALPALYHSRFIDTGDIHARIDSLLERCGILHLRDLRPALLNEFERKRVALARAWSLAPRLILVEDPLVDIDGSAGSRMMDLLFGASPPEWVGRDPRPERPAILLTSQGLHEALFRHPERLIVFRDGEQVFDGDPRQYDRRGKNHLSDLLKGEEESQG